jgi:hypothetical protein
LDLRRFTQEQLLPKAPVTTAIRYNFTAGAYTRPLLSSI